eukprot:scaffold21903_cov22-Tisochrysis_lutea.AAC.1
MGRLKEGTTGSCCPPAPASPPVPSAATAACRAAWAPPTALPPLLSEPPLQGASPVPMMPPRMLRSRSPLGPAYVCTCVYVCVYVSFTM